MNWGLVGASAIASEHVIGAIRATPGHRVAAVASADAGRARAYAARHAIPTGTADLEAMLADPAVDAIYVSSTNEKHHRQTLAALAAGKHVLCEKPLAMTLAEAEEMVGTAERHGRVLATNHHLRCAPSHRAIRELLAAGRIGRVLSLRIFHAVHLPEHLRGWRINDPAAGGGVIPDIVVHDADTVRFHLGEDPVEAVALAGQSGLGQGVEDSAMALLTMPSGAMVFTHESFTHPFAGTGLEIHGSEGSIVARGVMTQRPVGEITLIDRHGSHPVHFAPESLYAYAIARFAEAVAGSGRPAADGRDGAKSLAVALAVREAAREGRSVRVDYGGM